MHTRPRRSGIVEAPDGRATTVDISDLSLERFRTGRHPFKATVL
jgi:hypothetical protein